MIDKVVANRWITAADLHRDKKLNKQKVSEDAIQRMLKSEHLDAFRSKTIPLISEVSKQKRLEFCNRYSRWTKNWQRIVFTDESWLCA